MPIMHNTSRIETLKDHYSKLLNRVLNWKIIFSRWQLGTRDEVDGANLALKDHRATALKTHIELAALTELLLEKHIISQEDLLDEQIEVASKIDAQLAAEFPGATATDDGVDIQPDTFQATMDKLNFPL